MLIYLYPCCSHTVPEGLKPEAYVRSVKVCRCTSSRPMHTTRLAHVIRLAPLPLHPVPLASTARADLIHLLT